MSELGEYIADTVNTLAQTKRDLSVSARTNTALALTTGTIKSLDMPKIIETQSISSSDGFFIGNGNLGVVGENALGVNSSTGSYSVTQIINPNKIWKTLLTSIENSYWVDTGNTDATVSSQMIDFAAFNTFQTNRLTTEAVNINNVTVSLPNVVGTIYIGVSADDGSNYDFVTNNVNKVLTVPGKYLKLQIFTLASTASISIKDANGFRTPIRVGYN